MKIDQPTRHRRLRRGARRGPFIDSRVALALVAELAEAGATQIEPGHGLTGATSLHVVKDLPESPAVIYLGEVSHLIGSEAFKAYGGVVAIEKFDLDVNAGEVVALVGDNGAGKSKLPPAIARNIMGPESNSRIRLTHNAT